MDWITGLQWSCLAWSVAKWPAKPVLEPGAGFSGTVDVEIDLGDNGSITGTFGFRIDEDGFKIWGTGTSTDTATDHTMEFTTRAEDPVYLAPPSEDSGGPANLCSVDVHGPVEVKATGPSGIYAAILHFLFGSMTVEFTDATYAESEEDETSRIANHSAKLPSCKEPSINDWEGIFILDWFCDPPESGESRLTFTVTGPNTVHVSDEHPIGSGQTIEFDVTADDDNPHILRGFFTENDGPGTYREDVVFTLAPDGRTWTQDNDYIYLDGELEGLGGECFGTGTRTGNGN